MGWQPGAPGVTAVSGFHSSAKPRAPSVGVSEPLQGSAPAAGAPGCNAGAAKPPSRIKLPFLKGGEQPLCALPCPSRVEADGRDSYTEGQGRGDTAGVPVGHTGDTAGAVPGHRGDTAWVPVGHRGDTAGVPAGHTGDTAGVPVVHRGDTAGVPAGHSADTAGAVPGHKGDSAGGPAGHTGDIAGVPAGHSGDTAGAVPGVALARRLSPRVMSPA